MRGDGLQIAALAREIAGLKGRLAFLWNSERRRWTTNRREEGVIPSIPQPVATSNGLSANCVGQLPLVCVFVAGLLCGDLVTTMSICLGIWIGHLF